MFPKILAIVESLKARVSWVEFLIPFIPVFAEMLQQILQNCAATEDQAVALITAPSDAQLDYIHARLMRRMWWEPKVRRLGRAQREAMAWDVIWGTIAVARQDPAAIAAAHVEATAA